jgi:UDP-GlcNAc:undecaprenyl-phosphate/decaprenyl-phosphate GlcNAc-1-phosphate transferase
MISYLAAFAIAIVVAASLTPIMRWASLRYGLYDAPNARKVHARITPRTGGVAIGLGFFAPLIAIFLTQAQVGRVFYQNVNYMVGLVLGGVLVLAIGVLDDLKGLGAKKKLLGQVVAATIAFVAGFRIEVVSLPIGGTIEMGVFAYFVTVFWIVGVINALNLIDGLDGLAAGIGFLALVFHFVIGYSNESIWVCLVAASLAGAILGFLFYNFNPASIFMGDAGSMFIGFILALGAVNSGQKTPTTVALLTPIIAMGIPIMDTLFSIVRRFLERRPMFSPDRGHIHHRLLDMGFTHRRVVLILYSVSVGLVLLALLLRFSDHKWHMGVGLAILFMTVFVFARLVGVVQRSAAMKRYRHGIRTRHTQLIRATLPEAFRRGPAVVTLDDARDYLRWFLVAAEIEYVEVVSEGADEPQIALRNQDYPEASRQPAISQGIPFKDDDGRVLGHATFGWRSERGRVCEQTEILLQVVIDRVIHTLR